MYPIFNLYNREWPLLTNPPSLPPAKFSEGGAAHDSIVGAGTIISGGILHNSVVSYDVSVGSGSLIEGSVLMPSVHIGDKAIIRNAILDKNVFVEPGAQIDVGGEGPAGEIQLQGIGMAVGGGVGLQHVGSIGVMPPVIAG